MKNIFSDIICLSRNTNKEHPTPHTDNTEDYVAKAIGGFGRWQAATCVVTALTRFIVMWNMTAIFFLTPETDFVCVEFKNTSSTPVANSTCYDGCIKYEYYNKGLKSTLISDYNLICERQWLASLAQSVLMFGILIGTFIFGWISDRFGRRTSLIVSILINVIFMIVTPFSPNFWTFCFFRFITGIGTGGALTICIVIVMEVVGKDHRAAASCGLVQPDGLAQASLAIFAYYSPTWNIYALGYGIVSIVIFILVLFVPESPRWLISRGRIDEAIEIITKAAKCNNLDTSKIEEDIKKSIEGLRLNENEVANTSYLDLFQTKELAVSTGCVFIVWTISGTCFFGINQYLTFVGSNLYVAVVILGLIQMPIGAISWIINKYFGRKKASIGIHIVGGVIMILLIFSADYYWATAILGVIGFGTASSIFAIIYVFISELFPTPLRNMAFGFSSSGAKLGAMIAPFIANLRPQWVPSVVFAGILFIGAGFCLPLPETKGRNLKDSIV